MAKQKSNTYLFLKEFIKQTGHQLIYRNIKAIAFSSYFDKLYKQIEAEYPEYKEIKGIMPYTELKKKGYVFFGVLLSKSNIAIYEHTMKLSLFGTKYLNYNLKEYDIQNIELGYSDYEDPYKRNIYYIVTIRENGEELVSFHFGKKLFHIFEKAFNNAKGNLE